MSSMFTSVISLASLLSFYLVDLSTGECGYLSRPINSWSLMCSLTFSNVSFRNVGAPHLGHKCSEFKLLLMDFSFDDY